MTFRKLVFTVTLCLLAGLATGCGAESFSSQLDEIDDQFALQTDLRCDCYEVFPYPSKEDCVADNSLVPNTPEEQQCMAAALGRNRPASQETVTCLREALELGSTCYEESLVCEDLMNTQISCNEQMSQALEQCPPWTDLVQIALDAC